MLRAPNRWILTACLALSFGLAACSQSVKMHDFAMENTAAPAAMDTASSYRARSSKPGQPRLPLPDQGETGPKGDTGAQARRIMIYTAAVDAVVPDPEQAIEAVAKLARSMGGYVQSLEAKTIIVRVPAEKFESAMSAIDEMGRVTDRRIQSADVTEKMFDLKARLENAQVARKRLIGILEKAGEIKDTLAVEKELARVTETIELLKGKLRLLEERVAFSTITARFNPALPYRQLVVQIPFAWVRELGQDLMAGARPAAIKTGFFRGGIDFKMPVGFIKYYENTTQTMGMNAEGILFKLQRHKNYDGGNVAFWSRLIERGLVESRGIATDPLETLKTKADRPLHLLAGKKAIAGKPHGYLVGVVATKDHVYTYEAWGPAAGLDEAKASVVESIRSLSTR